MAGPRKESRIAKQSVPFLSDEPMVGPPSCSAADFEIPRLRKSLFDLTTLDHKRSSRIGGGLDGYVWKIYFQGDLCPYALKLYWDTGPPKIEDHYYAAQRECRNAALMQMITTAIHEGANGSTPPVSINPSPRTKRDAVKNTFLFSYEGRQAQSSDTSYEPVVISSVPRVKQCYGWVKIKGSEILKWPRRFQPEALQVDKIERNISLDEEHIAVIYEYIEEGANDPTTVEETTDFFWLAGFGYTPSSLDKNWVNSVLVDFSDIVHGNDYGFRPQWYGPRKAREILMPSAD